MIKEQDLLEAIAECQGERNPDARTCRNLAAFYTILDHIQEKEDTNNIEPVLEYSYDSNPGLIEYNSKSEFSKLIYGKDINDIMPIIDELMETLKLINPRLYDSVIKKI